VGFDDRVRSQSLPRNLQFTAIYTSAKEAEVQDKCVKNRRRSKRRGIYCLIHGCYLDSVSKKYYVFADRPEQLQARGLTKSAAQTLIGFHTTVSMSGEWLEAFWCDRCQNTQWYYVCKTSDRTYQISLAPDELWQRVTGVVHPNGNPSVGEFTRREARVNQYQGLKAFNTIR
jgi:hypothetical protein